MISALIRKDIKLFFRNQFFAVVTLLGIAAFIAIYYLLPANVDDQIEIAVFVSPEVDPTTREFIIQSLEAEELPSEEKLLESVENGDYRAGVVLSRDDIQAMSEGESMTIPIYTAPGTSQDLSQALEDIFAIGFNNLQPDTGASKINIEDNLVVLGPDLLGIGDPIAPRDRMLPLLILTLFSIELMGLANLISEEVESKTVQALLVTPLGIRQFFFSKAALGLGMAMIEAFFLITATGKLTVSPGIVIATLMTGSLMISGVAFLIASIAKNMMSVLSWSTLFLLALSLPGIAVIFPTMTSAWMKAIPSFYLVDILNKSLNYGMGWTEAAAGILLLGISGLVMLTAGSLLLERRFQ